MSNLPAFPTTKPLDSWGDPNKGMDLRDYFAANALSALALNQGSIGTEDYSFEEVALDAYLMADAMMKARELCSDTK